jgi:hypothetical protein
MIELFSIIAATEYFVNGKERFSNQNYSQADFLDSELYKKNYNFPTKIPMSWIFIMLLISFGTAYLAYCCSQYEKPASRAVMTIIAFFFSGFYLLYYFIYHVLLNKDCGSRSITNIVRNISKK